MPGRVGLTPVQQEVPSTVKTRTQASAGVERDGRAIPMTVFSLLRRGGEYVQRLVFWYGSQTSTSGILRLGFVHFARLAVIRRFPDHGQPADDLRQRLQLFESNYNESFASYIDTFVEDARADMYEFWFTSYGFPRGLPLGPFKRYIAANQFPRDHYYYYVRNPDVTVKMVQSALRVAQANSEFRRQAREVDGAEFVRRFQALLTLVQNDL